MKQELKTILYKIADMHNHIHTAEMKESIINKTVDEIAKLATPQKEINLDEVEVAVKFYAKFNSIGDPRYYEDWLQRIRERIGYSESDLPPSKPDQNG